MLSKEYVPVPVPVHLVPDVFRFVLDRAEAAQQATDRGTASERCTAENPSEWPDDELAEFFLEASQNPRAIMEVLAGGPGDRFTTQDFAAAIGKGDDPRGTWSVAGVLGAIQKSAKRRYGRDWPFDLVHDASSDAYYYAMPERYATMIARTAERLRSAIEGTHKAS